MNNNYMENWPDLFFNIKENKEIYDIVEQASDLFAVLLTRFSKIESDILNRSIESDEFANADMIIGLFIRKIMEQVDAINILFSVCSFTQAEIILRSMLENVVSLEYILKEDILFRTASYFLSRQYQDLEIGEECFNKELMNNKKTMIGNRNVEFNRNCEKFEKKKKSIEKMIQSNECYQKVDKTRNEIINKSKKKSRNIKWYKICNPKLNSFKDLMGETRFKKYYKHIYGGFSNEVHGLNSATAINVSRDGIALEWIRTPKGGGNLFSFVCAFSIGIMQTLNKYLNYREHEKKEFQSFFMKFSEKRDKINIDLDRII